MSELIGHDPTGRFSSVVDLYARHRPDYPEEALRWIIEQCGLPVGARVVDVGCGTGISSRQFAGLGLHVLGVEPNADMRAQAEAEPNPSILYLAGQAEATGLPEGVSPCVVCAQAFHWFDAPAALGEFHRILQPNGHAALFWNERDESDPFTAAYGAIIRATPHAPLMERARVQAGQALLDSPLFTEGRRQEFTHLQKLDETGLLGRAFSASYVPREPPLADLIARSLRETFARFAEEDRVTLRYITTVYLARRRAGRTD